MRVKIPTDPTIPNPQDPKDAPHSHDGGDSGFMPYVPAWERLADAIKRVMAGRAPERDGTNRPLPSHRRSNRQNSGANSRGTQPGALLRSRVLEGKDFEIPTEIKPKDLDWESVTSVKAMDSSPRDFRAIRDTGIWSGSRFSGPTLRKFCAPRSERPPKRPRVKLAQQAKAGRRANRAQSGNPRALSPEALPERQSRCRTGYCAGASMTKLKERGTAIGVSDDTILRTTRVSRDTNNAASRIAELNLRVLDKRQIATRDRSHNRHCSHRAAGSRRRSIERG